MKKKNLSRRMERLEHKHFDTPMTWPDEQGPRGFLPGNSYGKQRVKKGTRDAGGKFTPEGASITGKIPAKDVTRPRGRVKGQPTLSPMLNHNTFLALKKMLKERREETGDPKFSLADLIKEVIETDGLLEWLKIMAKYQPKEKVHSGNVNVDHQHNHRHTHESIPETSVWIAEVLGEEPDIEAPESVPDRPVLPS